MDAGAQDKLFRRGGVGDDRGCPRSQVVGVAGAESYDDDFIPDT